MMFDFVWSLFSVLEKHLFYYHASLHLLRLHHIFFFFVQYLLEFLVLSKILFLHPFFHLLQSFPYHYLLIALFLLLVFFPLFVGSIPRTNRNSFQQEELEFHRNY